jgi:uncharacterized membrane protein YphA (DoxX/SURF4 family)
LLVLRLALSSLAVVVVRSPLTPSGWPLAATTVSDVVLILSAAALLIGFLTPMASLAVGLGCIGIAVAGSTAASPHWLSAASAGWFVGAASVALALLGPGAFSLDARLFGRREVVIR